VCASRVLDEQRFGIPRASPQARKPWLSNGKALAKARRSPMAIVDLPAEINCRWHSGKGAHPGESILDLSSASPSSFARACTPSGRRCQTAVKSIEGVRPSPDRLPLASCPLPSARRPVPCPSNHTSWSLHNRLTAAFCCFDTRSLFKLRTCRYVQ